MHIWFYLFIFFNVSRLHYYTIIYSLFFLTALSGIQSSKDANVNTVYSSMREHINDSCVLNMF